MTSRETTGLLPRPSHHRVVGANSRSALDWAAVPAFAAITWPWLLASLRGGSRASKHALLARLGLPHDALPNLGGWKADIGLLKLVADHILEAKPKNVVEFGTGASTLIVAQALKLAGGGAFTSFEQHPEFVQATREWLAAHGLAANLRAVPLRRSTGGWPGLWYDHGELPERIDFMLIDGPPWTMHPLTRGAAANLFGRIAPGGVVMLDDAARPGERLVARRWRRDWPDFEFRLLKGSSKGTLVGTRRA